LGVSFLLLPFCLPHSWEGLCGKKQPEGTFKDSWRALEELVAQKKIRALGISNFGERDLEELLKGAKVKPAVSKIASWLTN
jgi:diketogulonate reductase-like aldo/keto reductase